MRLNRLQTLGDLKQLKRMPILKPLITKKTFIVRGNLSQIQLIQYSTSLGLLAARILRNEIIVPNKENVLNMTIAEIHKLYRMMQRNNPEETITRKEAKATFRSIGLKGRI